MYEPSKLTNFFMSKKTGNILAIIGIISIASIFYTARLIWDNTAMDDFDNTFRIFLIFFILKGCKENNELTMQAGTCALLVAIMYYQATYTLDTLLEYNVEVFISIGFWGSIYLAGQIMLLVLDAIYTLNHFEIYVRKRTNVVRMAVNQTSNIIITVFLLLQTMAMIPIMEDRSTLLYMASYNISLVSNFMLVAWVECRLAFDSSKGGDSL